MDASVLEDRWRSFYREECDDEVAHLTAAFPDERSLYVDVIDLYEFDDEFARALFADPEAVLAAGRAALASRDEGLGRVNVRVTNHPGLLGVDRLRARHVSELVSVEGVVTDTGPVGARVASAVFACGRCGERHREARPGLRLRPPATCPVCGAADSFRLRRPESTFVDVQDLELSDRDGLERDEEAARSVAVFVDDDLVDTVTPGQSVRVTGVVGLDRRGDANRFEHYVDAVTVSEEPSPGRREASAADALKSMIESRW